MTTYQTDTTLHSMDLTELVSHIRSEPGPVNHDRAHPLFVVMTIIGSVLVLIAAWGLLGVGMLWLLAVSG